VSFTNDFQAELDDKQQSGCEEPELERDEAEMRIAELEATLRDIVLGADMMLQPALMLRGAMKGYVEEVRRVARAGLYGAGV
jgi:hypothetical protein